MQTTNYDVVVIGGGFYGCSLALHLQQSLGQKVIILEMEPDLLQRASYANQARVHNGYHYPRSFLTALRSRINFPRFVDDFHECIDDRFEHYYAIARTLSKTTARQFSLFCDRINAPIRSAPKRVKCLFNPDYIEDVFLVREYAFDAVKLRRRMWKELIEAGVDVRLNTEVTQVRPLEDSLLEVVSAGCDETLSLTARSVLNCTYSVVNKLLIASGLPPIPLKHELAEIALVEVPEHLTHIGITVMDGPFFSIMPFPPRRLHSLSHVRYTPHCEYHDPSVSDYTEPYQLFTTLRKKTHCVHMLKDAQRYVPCLKDCHYVDSLWALKTVLPRSETDDSRPILLKPHYGFQNFTLIMGSKIDNIYDAFELFPTTASLRDL